jgi:hypothetical protein
MTAFGSNSEAARLGTSLTEPSRHRGATCCTGTVALGDPWQRRALACVLRSDCHSELVEDRAEPVAGGDVKGDVVVAAAQILHEGMTGGKDPR